MASSTLQKLLRNQSRPASTIFTHFRQSLSPSPPLPLTQIPKLHDPRPDQPETDHFKPKHSLSAQVYPSFSFEFFLNPVAPCPFIRPESDGEADEQNVIRADSVKKKRKKKMNKHKLKKLRKRMRRKT